MNWDAIGAIGEIVGAIAVIATLFYVAVQIRMSNKIAMRDARQGLLGMGVQTATIFLQNPALAELRPKLSDPDFQPTPQECEQMKDIVLLLQNTCAAVGVDMELGLLDEQICNRYRLGYLNQIQRYPALKPVWREALKNSGLRLGQSPWWDPIIEAVQN